MAHGEKPHSTGRCGTSQPSREFGRKKGAGGRVTRQPPRSALRYRFMLTRSARISSEAVMIRLFAWNPRWAMIMFVNS